MSLLENIDYLQLIITISVVAIPLILSLVKKHNFSEIVFSENIRMIRFIFDCLIKSIIFSTVLAFFMILNDHRAFMLLMSSQTEFNYSIYILTVNYFFGAILSIAVIFRIVKLISKEYFFELFIESIRVWYYSYRTKKYSRKGNKSNVEQYWYRYVVTFTVIPLLLIFMGSIYVFESKPVILSIYTDNSAIGIQAMIIFYLFIIFFSSRYYYNTNSVISVNKVYDDFTDIRGKLTFVSIDKDKTYFVNKNNNRFYILYPNSGKVYEFRIDDKKSVKEKNSNTLEQLKLHNQKYKKKLSK